MADVQAYKWGWPIRRINYRGAAIWEVKAYLGGVYLSTNTGQLRGHIDNMSSQFTHLISPRIGEFSGAAVTLVTTADVNYSRGNASHAAYHGVHYNHVVSYYTITKSGNFTFQFYPIGTNP